MTTAHRYRPLLLLLGAVLTLAVTAGFLVLRYAPSNTVTLPIEVIGPDGYTQSVTVVASDGAQAQDLYLQAYSIGYPYYEDFTVNKASVRINGGPWTDITNDVATCQFPESNLDCVGGPYPTIRFEIPVADIGGSLQNGSNTIDFRFNYAFPADSPDDFGSPSTGYRILDLELRNGADMDLIDGTTFVWDDPSTWAPPAGYDDPQSISDGEALWHDRDILIDGWDGHTIRASCADCHAADGRDLQYFAFSNKSIVARSAFHGLTDDEGKKIAAYIRSYELKDVDDGHTYAPPARPWTPVYQPGPTSRASRGEDAPREQGTSIENMPSNGSQYWAAGAGLEWALDHDEETMPYLFPGGTVSKETFYPENSLPMWKIPTALQFADWNEWLPVHHPLDIWGDAWVGTHSWEMYYGTGTEISRYDNLINCWEANGNNGDCIGEAQRFMGGVYKATDDFSTSQPSPKPAFSDLTDEDEHGFRRVNIKKWAAVKQWEVQHTFDLADENAYDTEGSDLNWLTGTWAKHRAVFDLAPHISGLYAGPKMGSWDFYLDNAWYGVNTRINHGRGVGIGLKPNDWKYHFGHIGYIDGLGVPQDARWWTAKIKVMQNCETFDPGNNEPRAWYIRTGHCGIGSPYDWNTHDALDAYQPGFSDPLMEAFMRYIVERMMYKYSPVTYDQQTGSFSGDVDANWTRDTGLSGWEPETVKPSFDAEWHKPDQTPGHHLIVLDNLSGRNVSPTLLDSAAVWLNAMNPDPQWDAYRCASSGGSLDCSSSSNQPPVVDLAAPTGGATFTDLSSLTIEADASDPDGSVAIVEFFADDTKLGEDADAPFTYAWSDPTAGSYDLTARATDNDGLTTTSAGVSVTIEAGEGTTTTQAIPLTAGWNLISSHVAPDSANMESVFNGMTTLVIVKDEQGNTYAPSESVNDIGSWTPNEGYMVHVTAADTLQLSGAAVGTDTPITLREGWNLVPYYPSTAQPVSEALGSIADDLVMVKDQAGRAYIPDYNVDRIGDLLPGQSYKIYVSSRVDLVYGDGSNAPMTAATVNDDAK